MGENSTMARVTMPSLKTVAFSSHGGLDHVASTPRQISSQSRFSNQMSVLLAPSRSLGFRRMFFLLFSTLPLILVPGPLTQVVKRSLTITNQNSLPVAFKVKTTAPKVTLTAIVVWVYFSWVHWVQLYCVRPNSGRVEPGESVEVSGKRVVAASSIILNSFLLSSVMLQPLKEEPPLNSKCKDKFLVQSTFITPDKETMALHDLVSVISWFLVLLFLNTFFQWLGPDMGEEGVVHQQKLRVLYLPAEEGPLEEEDETVPVNPPVPPEAVCLLLCYALSPSLMLTLS